MMTNGLPVVPLGEFLTQRKEFFTIDDFVKYKRARVKSHGQGIVLRDEVNGTEIKTKKQQAARTGEFLVAEIDAKVGGFGIVPPELDGAVVSSHYFLFQIDESKCSKEWLNWFVRYNSLEEQTKAQGSTNYAAIRPSDVLNFEIPLPPLTEQRRIVAHIESLAARVNEAQRLREEASEGREALLHSAMRQIFKADGTKIVPLETTCAAIIDNLHSNPDYSGDCVVPCIRSSDVGWGELFLETARKTSEAEFTRRTVRGEPAENDIVLVREGGGTGKAALVEKHHRFSLGQRVMMLRPDQSVVLPKFLLYQILSPFIYDEQIIPLSKGSASPHLNIGALRKFKFILPPLDEQRRIVAYLDGLQAKVNALRGLQSQTQEELDALLPSVLDRAFKGEL
jgi:type I restriction enzyme S subunit